MKNGPSKFAIFTVLIFGVLGAVQAATDDKERSLPAWKRWKSIEAAITLRELDGPEDIIEKAEIIEDRVDDLVREQTRQKKKIDGMVKMLEVLYDQRRLLQDLMELQPGGEHQARQRMRDLQERIRREEALHKRELKFAAELSAVLGRLKHLALEYRKKAEDLRIQEEGAQ
jgi:hypothetical protein